ncbi:MAG: S8 family serine peptidase [Pseudomonadota bacterium]|nr:S8 family serine peptidase [Pseudomonadota bacterium]
MPSSTSNSRFLPLAVLSSAVALLLVAPSGAPAPQSGDMVPAEAGSSPAQIAVDFVDGVDLALVRAAADRAGVKLSFATSVSEDEALFVADAADPAAALAVFLADPNVEAAEPVLEMTAFEDIPEVALAAGPTAGPAPDPAPRIFGYPNDPMYERQWNFALIGAPVGWRVGGGAGVVVAVIDTGVSPLPDLPAERILPGRSFVPGASTAADDNGHGTHVAGTIAQATHNGVGTAGIAPNVTILPLKVLGASGGGMSTWIASAIDEAVDQGADVINLSLGGGHSSIIVTAVEKARKAGVVVVAAAGNTGRQGIGSPADAPAAIAVTAVGPNDTLAPYSSWGKGVEIAAPGGDKTVPGGGIVQATIQKGGTQQFAEFQGTSMATPHVAGAAAILIGAGAQSADEVERYLKTTADGREDPLKFGAGRLDLGAAVRALLLAKQGLLFAVGALLTLGLGLLGGLPGRVRMVSLLFGATIAGGVFFLPLLPLPPSTWLGLLGRPFLSWPGPFWSGFPLWQSCLLPLGLAVILGPSKALGPLALGLCGGIGGYLLYGAATGGTDLWWMPMGFDRTWLTLNGTVCLLAGMAVAGMQKMRRRAA